MYLVHLSRNTKIYSTELTPSFSKYFPLSLGDNLRVAAKNLLSGLAANNRAKIKRDQLNQIN